MGYIQISMLGKWHSRLTANVSEFEPDGQVGCLYVECRGFLQVFWVSPKVQRHVVVVEW